MGKFIDLTGNTYTYLTVKERLPNNKAGQAFWLCECKCGNTKKVSARNLKVGNVKSCGCYFNIGGTTHGLSFCKCPEYEAWRGMKRRCAENNKKCRKDYFCRGIKVCDEWVNDFMSFYNYIGKRPSDKHSIDRINNDGNYEIGNIRWAIPPIQSRNKRSNVYITYNGKCMILKDWAIFFNVTHDAIEYHLKKGRTMEQIDAHFRHNKSSNIKYSRWKVSD